MALNGCVIKIFANRISIAFGQNVFVDKPTSLGVDHFAALRVFSSGALLIEFCS